MDRRAPAWHDAALRSDRWRPRRAHILGGLAVSDEPPQSRPSPVPNYGLHPTRIGPTPFTPPDPRNIPANMTRLGHPLAAVAAGPPGFAFPTWPCCLACNARAARPPGLQAATLPTWHFPTRSCTVSDIHDWRTAPAPSISSVGIHERESAGLGTTGWWTKFRYMLPEKVYASESSSLRRLAWCRTLLRPGHSKPYPRRERSILSRTQSSTCERAIPVEPGCQAVITQCDVLYYWTSSSNVSQILMRPFSMP